MARSNQNTGTIRAVSDEMGAPKAIETASEFLTERSTQVKDAISRGAGELVDTVSTKLNAYGVDTDAVTQTVKEQSIKLRDLIGDELRSRPVRALGIAAGIGLVIGFMSRR
jgi:ElaB/YqjD/DUF883 family membrane-anchored ribosome-binding protein